MKLGDKAGISSEERRDEGAAASETGDGDVGEVGATLGRQAGAHAGAIDLEMQRLQRRAGLRPDPERVRRALSLEMADALQPSVEGREPDRGQRVRNILRLVAIDFADEAQSEVKLGVILPARPFYAGLQCDRRGALVRGRTDGDEQAMHGAAIAARRAERYGDASLLQSSNTAWA